MTKLDMREVGIKTLKYVRTLPKREFHGKLEVIFVKGKASEIKVEERILDKNIN